MKVGNRSILTRAIVVMLTIAVLAVVVGAQTIEQKLDEYMKASVNVYHYSGTVLIARNGKPILAKGYGMADRDKSIPNSVDTKFQIGSVTKQFTATAIMQLVAAGKIKLDDHVTAYLPDYPKATGDKITIRNLLCHEAGVPNYTDNPAAMARRGELMTVENVVSLFKDLPLDFTPGTKFQYSNSGYVVLGLIIEKVSGLSYADYIKKHILDVAGMQNSGYLDYSMPNLATGYQEDSAKQIVPSIEVTPNMPYAAGALCSTVKDMLLWDQALYGEKILSQASLKQMWTPYMSNYGFGWVIDSLYGHKRIWHNGGIDGFISEFHRFVDDGYCIVLFSNCASAPSGQMAASLAAILFDKPYAVPLIKSPIKIDPAQLADYVGAFQVAPNAYRVITRQGDSLFSQRTGSASRLILPEAKDKFYFEYDNSITLEFLRGADGKVSSHRITQMGQPAEALLITGPVADSLLKPVDFVSVDSTKLDLLAGSYQLAPGFLIEVRRKGTSLFIQATGQPEFEAFPKSETEFFLKVVDARLSFNKDSEGKVTTLVLHQGGQDIPGPRVK